MKIIVPMAGRGSRLADAGYELPKPLIEIEEQPMFKWALQSIDDIPYDQIAFIILREHDEQFDFAATLKQHYPQSNVVILDAVTEGQLQTILMARDFINVDDDLLIANCDTYLKADIATDIKNREERTAGIISVADLPGDRWSFARTDDTGYVVEVAEKVRISDYASTGLYYFSDGAQFVSIAETMIANQEKTRGEYYVIPVYQKLIEMGQLVEISIADEVWDMGNPEALNRFKAYLESNVP